MVRKDQTRNFEIPGSMLSHRPGMTCLERTACFHVAKFHSPILAREPARIFHHLRWLDIYQFRRTPVYQRFRCDRAALRPLLRVSRGQRRL